MALSSGVLKGNVITLDAPVPDLEGRRVLVVVEPADGDADIVLSPEENARLLREWAQRELDGPIDDEDDPEWE